MNIIEKLLDDDVTPAEFDRALDEATDEEMLASLGDIVGVIEGLSKAAEAADLTGLNYDADPKQVAFAMRADAINTLAKALDRADDGDIEAAEIYVKVAETLGQLANDVQPYLYSV